MGEIRAWAKAQGFDIGDRGMIPADILDQYKRAHGMSDTSSAFELLEPAPEPAPRSASTRSLEDWLELRDELAALIEMNQRPEWVAERILLAGWIPPLGTVG